MLIKPQIKSTVEPPNCYHNLLRAVASIAFGPFSVLTCGWPQDEALSSMMRAGKKSNDELFSRSRQTLFPSASSRKSFETLVSTVYGRSAPRSLEEDAGRRRDNGRSEHYDVADIKIISNGFAKRHQLCRDDDDRSARDTSPGK